MCITNTRKKQGYFVTGSYNMADGKDVIPHSPTEYRDYNRNSYPSTYAAMYLFSLCIHETMLQKQELFQINLSREADPASTAECLNLKSQIIDYTRRFVYFLSTNHDLTNTYAK